MNIPNKNNNNEAYTGIIDFKLMDRSSTRMDLE
jgi:hypothetical protein